jgi:hypothetical protein
MSSRNPRNLDLFWGIFIVLSINIVVMFLLCPPVLSRKHHLSIDTLASYFNLAVKIDLGQLIYILPLIIWLTYLQKREFMKGVIIGAVITVLINFGGCYLFLTMR